MFNKVIAVIPFDNYVLQVQFEDNVTKMYDVKKLFQSESSFETLRDVHGLFKLVKVDTGGYGISWNDEIDISSDELWKNGKY